MTTTTDPAAPAPSEPPERRSFSGAIGWSYVMFGGRQLVMLVVTFLLAAILGPEAYGTVAMAQTFIVFVQIVQRQGLIPALVHTQDLRPAHLHSAYWLVTVVSIIVVILSFPFGRFFADVTDLPDLAQLVPVMALGLPLRGSALVPEALFQREMDFKSLAIRTNVATLIGGVVGVVLAFAGAGAWALAAQALATDLADSVAIWTMTKYRPRLQFERSATRDILRQASGTSVAGIANFGRQRFDLLIVGVVFGAAPAGLYRLATRFTDLVLELTMRGIQGVSLPELARLQSTPDKLRKRFLEIIRLTSIMALPLLGILAAVAPEAVGLLGDKWKPAAVPLAILCIATAGQLHPLMTTPALQAIGKYKALAATTWGVAILTAVAAYAPVPFVDGRSDDVQLAVVAASRAFMLAVLIVPIYRWAYAKYFDVEFKHVFLVQLPSIMAGFAGFMAVAVVRVLEVFDGLALVPRGIVHGLIATFFAACVLFAFEPMVRNMKSQFKNLG